MSYQTKYKYVLHCSFTVGCCKSREDNPKILMQAARSSHRLARMCGEALGGFFRIFIVSSKIQNLSVNVRIFIFNV